MSSENRYEFQALEALRERERGQRKNGRPVNRRSSVDEGSGNKKAEAKQRGAAGFRDMGLEGGVPIPLSAELFSAAARELSLLPSRLFWNTEIVDSA